jgi:hypothetical protein
VPISVEHESLYSNPSITVYSISPLTSLTGAVSYSYSVNVISLIEAIQARRSDGSHDQSFSTNQRRMWQTHRGIFNHA